MWKRKQRHRIPRALVVRYILFQLPALALVAGIGFFATPWLGLPPWLPWLLVGLWAVKDAALFPFTWQAYDGGQADRNPLIGQTAIVTECLDPGGRVRLGPESWAAELSENSQVPVLREGARVRIHGIRGLTLFVGPMGEGD